MLTDHPFRAIHADAWDPDLPDVPSLNEAASRRILQCVDDVRRAGAQNQAPPRSSSVLLLGPAGSGKTHLFARLRNCAGSRAVFVHSRPVVGLDPSPQHVLTAIVEALRRPVALDRDYRQADVIVGAMLAAMQGEKAHFPLAFLDDCRRNQARHAIVQDAIERLEDEFHGISSRYLERLLQVPFADRPSQRALFAWLSGGEPNQADLDRIDEKGPLTAADVMPAIRVLGIVATYGAPIVLVFDQLENLAEEEGHTGKILAHARLYSELRDTVRGLVLVQMALDAEWTARVHPVLHASDRDRLEENVAHLALPRPDERKALIECWRASLPEQEQGRLFPYPLTQAEFDKWVRMPGVTPRMLMQVCGEAYLRGDMPGGDVPEVDMPVAAEPFAPVPPPDDDLLAAWKELLDRARRRIDEAAAEQQGVSPDAIRAGLLAAFELIGVKPKGPAVKDVPSVAIRKEGLVADVLIAQHAHHRSLGAAIRTAIERAGQAKVILLRQRAFPISPSWKHVRRLLDDFTAMAGGMFFEIDREDLARLLAVEELLSSARSQDLSGGDGRPVPYRDVLRWAQQTLGCSTWPPIAAVGERLHRQLHADRDPDPAEPAERRPAHRAPAPPPEPTGLSRRPREVSGPGGPPAASGPVRSVLERLRVASMDRLVRETRAIDPAATRASVKLELDRLPVKVFGTSIIALKEPWP